MENRPFVGKICPFCRTTIQQGEEVKICPACEIPHHLECWQQNRGCTTFGCSEQDCEERGAAVAPEMPTVGQSGETLADAPTVSIDAGGAAPVATAAIPARPEGLAEEERYQGAAASSEPEQSRFCAFCGSPIAPEYLFCAKCGRKRTDFRSGQAAAAPKRKRKAGRLWILGAALVVLVVAAGAVYFRWVKPDLDVHRYRENAGRFCVMLRENAEMLEIVKDTVGDYWYRGYIMDESVNGKFYATIDGAIDGAMAHEASRIADLESGADALWALYDERLSEVPDAEGAELSEIYAAVTKAYSVYESYYDCVIFVEGSYNSWTADFKAAQREFRQSLSALEELLDSAITS